MIDIDGNLHINKDEFLAVCMRFLANFHQILSRYILAKDKIESIFSCAGLNQFEVYSKWTLSYQENDFLKMDQEKKFFSKIQEKNSKKIYTNFALNSCFLNIEVVATNQ